MVISSLFIMVTTLVVSRNILPLDEHSALLGLNQCKI